MTVKPSYRIDQSQISGVSYSDGFVEQQIEAGWLIPDTRLQAIADAPRCEHGRIDKHDYLTESTVPTADMWIRCQGAPELRSLFDALTEENNDDS